MNGHRLVIDEGQAHGEFTVFTLMHYEGGQLVIDLKIAVEPNDAQTFLRLIREGQYKVNK